MAMKNAPEPSLRPSATGIGFASSSSISARVCASASAFVPVNGQSRSVRQSATKLP